MILFFQEPFTLITVNSSTHAVVNNTQHSTILFPPLSTSNSYSISALQLFDSTIISANCCGHLAVNMYIISMIMAIDKD